jgi:hypothetical protein
VRHPVRSSLPLPLWTKPRAPTVAVGDVGECLCSCHLAGGLSASWYVGFGNYNKINAEHQTVQDTTDGGGSLGSGGPR